MRNKTHDDFFKFLFSSLTAARAFFEKYLPLEISSLLDFDTLQEDDTALPSRRLRAFAADKLFVCQGKKTVSGQTVACLLRLMLLVEHKSNKVTHPHLQLLSYMTQSWYKQLRSQTGRRDKKNMQPKKLRPFVALILYNGEKSWEETVFYSYFEQMPEPLKRFQPAFDYVFVDLSKVPMEEISNLKVGFLAMGLLLMKFAANKGELETRLRYIFERGEDFLKTEEGKDFVETAFVYLQNILELSGEKAETFVEKNMPSMYKYQTLNVFEEKFQLGVSQGISQGVVQGKIEGKIEMLTRIIKKMKHLSDEELAAWLEEPIELVREARILAKDDDPQVKTSPLN